MKELMRKRPIKENPMIKIADKDISAILDIHEPYAIACEKFEILRTYCLQTLGVTRDNPSLHKPYKVVMDHYLRNSAHYIMDTCDFKCSDTQEITEYKHNYILFLSVITRIGSLDKEQKESFLKRLKIQYDAHTKGDTENPVVIMDRALSSL